MRRLLFISRAKQLGLPLDGIRELAAVWEDGPCASVKARLEELLTARSKDVAERISELAAFGADLERARDDLAVPSPVGPCADGCGCVGSQVQAVELSRARPIGPARIEQRPAQQAETPLACTLSSDGQAARLVVASVLAGAVRGVFALTEATLVTDHWGADRYAAVSGVFNAPLTAAGAIAPSIGAAIAASAPPSAADLAARTSR